MALYRKEDFPAAVEALRKADAMREGGDRAHRMFLAMAHWKLSDEEKARELYAQGAVWIASRRKNNGQFNRFRAEAEQLMGIEPEQRQALIKEYLKSSSEEEASND